MAPIDLIYLSIDLIDHDLFVLVHYPGSFPAVDQNPCF